MESLCFRCKGKGLCGKPCKILQNLKQFRPKPKKEFSGSSADIFVGRFNYPNVFSGILAPQEYGDTERFSMPELWFKENASIDQIMNYRARLIYNRFQTNIKKSSNMLETEQEIAMAYKAVATEFKLKKEPRIRVQLNVNMPIISNPATLEKVRLEENPKIKTKVDYLVNDTDAKSVLAMNELYNSGIQISNIINILAAGLLGKKKNRRLVPSRWAITAADDTLSKIMLKEIKTYPVINDFLLFNSEYLGNHYEFILIPDVFSFEVIEAKMPCSVWNPLQESETYFAIDYESFYGRKEYAENVTGAYYSNRLALTEYLERVKRQASCLVVRECREEYWAPCGVGILREASRNAFLKKPEKFNTLNEALNAAQKRMRMPISVFTKRSQLLTETKKQKKLSEFL